MTKQDGRALVSSATGSLSGDETRDGASALASRPTTPDQAEATREGANSEAGAARISSPAPFFDTRRVHLADG